MTIELLNFVIGLLETELKLSIANYGMFKGHQDALRAAISALKDVRKGY